MKNTAKLLLVFFSTSSSCVLADLSSYRLDRAERPVEVQEAAAGFETRVKNIMEAPVSAKIQGLVPYEECRAFYRRQGVGKMGTVDLADAICLDEVVKTKEKDILEQRKTADEQLAKLELASRFVGIVNATLKSGQDQISNLGAPFTKICGLNEACLQSKQINRAIQIRSATTLRLNLIYLETLVPNFLEKAGQRKRITDAIRTGVKRTETFLNDIFSRLESRKDLPW